MVKLCYTTSDTDRYFVTGPSLHTDKVCSWPSGREFVEVYVSSVANPHTFFVQILTSMSLRLDEVVKSMSQYYATERQVRKHITALRHIKTGEKTYNSTTTKIGEYVTGLCHRKMDGYIAVPRHRNTGKRTLKILCHSTPLGDDRENM